MKNLIAGSLLFIVTISFAQTYMPDTTFGTEGIITNNLSIYPSKGLLIQGNYYLLSGNTLTCVNYEGEIVNNFGTDGMLTIFTGIPSYETVSTFDFVFHDGFIYVYGNVSNNNYNTQDMLVCKLSPNGSFDTTFGNGGVARIDLGLRDRLNNLVFEPDGGLFCIGTTNNPFINEADFKTIYFKLQSNGNINYSFDASGYKSIQFGTYNRGGAIIAYGQDYLLIGTTPSTITEVPGYVDMYITKINANGVIDSSYGNGGFKRSGLADGVGGNSILSVQLQDNKLFVKHYYSFSFITQGVYLQAYDLNSDQKLYDQSQQASSCDLSVIGDKIYSTIYNTGGSNEYLLDNAFNIKKKNLDGTSDTTFHINGIYSYEFPYTTTPFGSSGASASYCFIAEDDGKFAIAGRIYEMFTNKFGMMRITTESLATPNLKGLEVGFSPNPFNSEIEFRTNAIVDKIEVFDLIGRKVATPKFNRQNSSFVVDLSQITQPGTYVLKADTASGPIIKKITKK